METPPTVVIELYKWSPPMFRVLHVDERIISKSNLKAGEILTDTDLDYIMDIFGEFGVQVNYPKEPN